MPHKDEVRCYKRGTDIEKKKHGATQWMSEVECVVQSASVFFYKKALCLVSPPAAGHTIILLIPNIVKGF